MPNADYQTNRSRLPREQLDTNRGCWVAFSPDGQRIIASAHSLDKLEDNLVAACIDPQQVVFERIPEFDEDMSLGGIAHSALGSPALLLRSGNAW